MDNNTKQNDQTKLYALAICEMRTMDGRIIATNPKKKNNYSNQLQFRLCVGVFVYVCVCVCVCVFSFFFYSYLVSCVAYVDGYNIYSKSICCLVQCYLLFDFI